MQGGEIPPCFKTLYMAHVKNMHLLTDADQAQRDLMDHAATEHSRHNNISFKIIEYGPKKVIIQAAQGKNAAAVYHNKKRLIEIVNETFGRFFPAQKIIVQPIPFEESPATKVNADWINKKMLHTGTRLKDIAADTGLNYTHLSELVNGGELSQAMKALFWFYFLSKETVSMQSN